MLLLKTKIEFSNIYRQTTNPSHLKNIVNPGWIILRVWVRVSCLLASLLLAQDDFVDVVDQKI